MPWLVPGLSVLGYCRNMVVQHGNFHGERPAPFRYKLLSLSHEYYIYISAKSALLDATTYYTHTQILE